MADHVVHVFQDSDGEFRVYPPVLIVKKAKSVKLVNHASEGLSWIVPAGPFGGILAEAVNSKQSSGDKTTVNDGATSYMVLMQSGKKAKGNSDPIIIIEP